MHTDTKKFILFDFDGVIADSFLPAFEVNKMMCPHITEEDYRKRFEGNINDAYKIKVKHTRECRQDIDFFKEYLPKMKDVKMVPGILEVIENLSHIYTLIIVSSTITSPIREFMERYDAVKYFKEIMGNDVHKSKVEKIKMVFEKYNISRNQCLFITDTLGDMKEASRVGVRSIGVSWGFQDRETLEKGSPLFIADSPKQLEEAISRYL